MSITSIDFIGAVRAVWNFIQPLVPYLFMLGGIWIVAKLVFKLGELHKEFKIFAGDIKDIKTKISKVVLNLTTISSHLVVKTGLDSKLLQTMSPLSLTEKAEKLISKIGFNDYFESNKSATIEKLKAGGPTTLVELDDLSQELAKELQNKNEPFDYKTVAFENGISTDLLVTICAIYIRDKSANSILKKKKTQSN